MAVFELLARQPGQNLTILTKRSPFKELSTTAKMLIIYTIYTETHNKMSFKMKYKKGTNCFDQNVVSAASECEALQRHQLHLKPMVEWKVKNKI